MSKQRIRWLTAKYQNQRVENEEEDIENYGINVHEGDENRADATWQVKVADVWRHGPQKTVKKYKNMSQEQKSFINPFLSFNFDCLARISYHINSQRLSSTRKQLYTEIGFE